MAPLIISSDTLKRGYGAAINDLLASDKKMATYVNICIELYLNHLGRSEERYKDNKVLLVEETREYYYALDTLPLVYFVNADTIDFFIEIDVEYINALLAAKDETERKGIRKSMREELFGFFKVPDLALLTLGEPGEENWNAKLGPLLWNWLHITLNFELITLDIAQHIVKLLYKLINCSICRKDWMENMQFISTVGKEEMMLDFVRLHNQIKLKYEANILAYTISISPLILNSGGKNTSIATGEEIEILLYYKTLANAIAGK